MSKLAIEVTKTTKRTIERCYHDCPHFYLDGGPGPVMACGHPDTEARYEKLKNLAEIYIISHPNCDNGFPERCPLLPENKNLELLPKVILGSSDMISTSEIARDAIKKLEESMVMGFAYA